MNILDFGAVGDGISLNTAAIQGAMDACHQRGGGRVTVPCGVFKTGTLWMRSGVELHLEMGAELLASDAWEDYNASDAYAQNWGCPSEGWVGKHLLIAHEVKDVALTGQGRINGNCHAFVTEMPSPRDWVYSWDRGVSRLKNEEAMRPGQLLCFIECQNVVVQDVTVVDSPCWSLYLLGCEEVRIRGIRIKNPIWMLNSDGIDIDVCRSVTVSDCIIDTGDDAIAIRACEHLLKTKQMHCEYVTVTNCILSSSSCGIRLGVGVGEIRHVLFSNLLFPRCSVVAEFCTAYEGRGCAHVENVRFSGIEAPHANRVLELSAQNGARVRGITLENVRAHATMSSRIFAEGGTVEDVALQNVAISYEDKHRAEDLSPRILDWRGNCLLSVKGASRVSLCGVTLRGSLDGASRRTEFEDAISLQIQNCEFGD